MKKAIITISVIALMITAFVMYVRIVAIPREEYRNKLRAEIYEFKNNLTSEAMKTYIVSKNKIPEEIEDLKIEQLTELIREAKWGGVSHPFAIGRLTFRENKEGDFFEIEINFEDKEGRKFVYFYISKYQNGDMVDGIPFNNKELITWAYDIGFFK